MLRDEYDLAADDFAEAVRLDPNSVQTSWELLDALAQGLAADGKFPKAAEWETRAVNSAPDEIEARVPLPPQKFLAGKP